MTNTYQEKKQAKIERYRELAEKARQESDISYSSASKIGSMIPFGQPILIGHHSEKRHRRDIARIDNKMQASINLSKKAEYYEDKASAAENNNAISSDDPEAITLLKEKVEKLEKQREEMKLLNRTWKKFEKTEDREPLYKLGYTDSLIERQITSISKHWEKKLVKTYELTNLGANIKRLKSRIIELERKSKMETKEIIINGITLVTNIEHNRIQIFFDGKPEQETRTDLKRNGFRWSPLNGCWQAYIKQWNYNEAVRILESL